ncbi:MAG: hypothetical protein JXA03_06155 [Bacteroidales bacterium]|nr:hypothetical protein [Bacteroidales bacterium]
MNKIFYLALLFFVVCILHSSPAQSSADNAQAYKETIVTADQYFAQKDYVNAKASYQYASRLKPGDPYAKEMLQKTMELLKARMEVVDAYDAAIRLADESFRNGNYDDAIAKYSEAERILPGETYPAQRISEISAISETNNRLEADYSAAIGNGDRLLKNSKLKEAKAEYEKARSLKPGESYPLEKIGEISVLEDEMENAEKSYSDAIASADRMFSLKYYEQAREGYEKALIFKPDDAYTVSKLKEIEAQLVKKQEFDKLVEEADELYINRDHAAAKARYQEALKIYPSESYPKGMIDKINETLNANRDKDELYAKAISDADHFFDQKDYANAREEYKNALSVKPGEKYPADRISDIDAIVSEQQQKEDDYQLALKNGDAMMTALKYAEARTEYEKALAIKPGDPYLTGRIEEAGRIMGNLKATQESYDKSIADGDAFFSDSEYDKALKEYENALLIMPGQPYPSQKISEINALKKDLASKEALYSKSIADANKKLEKTDYPGAVNAYQEALTYKPGDSFASGKVAEIEAILSRMNQQQQSYDQIIVLADKLFSEKKYEEAKAQYQQALQLKPGEKQPSDRIKECDKNIENLKLTLNLYNQAIQDADKLFADGKFSQAIPAYENAGNYRPNEQYPKQKIFEINKMLEEQKAVRDQYNTAIKDADNLFRQQYYDQAKVRYEAASGIKPDEQYPKSKIEEINGILAGIAQTHDAYTNALSAADASFNAGNYEEAVIRYQEALKVKPGESYPKDRIAESNTRIENLKKKEAEYNTMIGDADRLFALKKYPEAKSRYMEASGILPLKTYPKEKMAEIDGIVQAGKDALEKSYNEAVAGGDELFAKKEYEGAKLKYQEALKIKPGQDYPQSQIAEIERLVFDLKTLQANFNKLVADGDAHFKAKEYSQAKTKYFEASKLFPKEDYPKNQLEEINRIFQADMKKTQEAYDKSIADADKYYNAKVYDQAIDNYRTAHAIKADETYPQEMIAKISRVIEENAVRDIVSASTLVENMNEVKIPFEPVSIADRKSNYIFVKARNTGEAEFKVFLNYGRGGTKNGGVIIKIPPNTEENEFFIRIGQQYKWFTEDNDWLGFIAEGGSVELLRVKISTGN